MTPEPEDTSTRGEDRTQELLSRGFKRRRDGTLVKDKGYETVHYTPPKREAKDESKDQ